MKITFAQYQGQTVEVNEKYMSTDTAKITYRGSTVSGEVAVADLTNVQTYDRADVADSAGYYRVVVLPRYSLDQLLDALQKAAALNDYGHNGEQIQIIRNEIKNRMN